LTNLTGPSWGPASKSKPRQLVVMCHGVGANGQDLISLAPFLGPQLPNTLFVAPNAPEPHEQGGPGYQWFSLGNFDLTVMNAGVRRAAVILDRYIDDQLVTHGIVDYVIAGFSQGAMTALFTGLRRRVAPRGIIAIAGALLDPVTLSTELTNHAPVLLCHGERDDVIPPIRSRQTAEVLRANNVPVETLFSPQLGHGIDQTLLPTALAFLKKVLA